MQKKSIKVNAFFSLIQSVSTVIFPLITFPYISRILGVEQLGKYNYAKNFVEIFAIIAMLGIPTYGQREGAKVREDHKELSNLMSELFSLNMVSDAVALIALYWATFFFDTFHSYALLIVIFSVTIPMTTIGMSWLFVVLEDYSFPTLFSILFNLLSVVAMFLLVHKRTDIYVYAFITVMASSGFNILKFVYSKRFCDIKFTFHINLKKHMKPIILMFSAYISVMIYNKTDVALLGIMESSYSVGIYSVSTKVYNLVKSCLLAISNVLQTKAVLLTLNGDREKSDKFISESFNMMMTFVIPCMIGMAFMNKDIILFIAGKDYLEAGTSMIILSCSLFFALFSTIHSSIILIPYGREKVTLYGAIIGAVVNLFLNFIFIPLWQENGAALTTLVAEATVFLIYLRITRQYYTHFDGIQTMLQCLVGSIGIVIVLFILRNLEINIAIRIFVKICMSSIVYFALQLITRNKIIVNMFCNFLNKAKVSKYKK